jgi:AcrR family transcriptional regulator
VRTQQALRAAFLTAIETKSLEEVSIRDIVAAAGIGYATYFRHYSSKADLLQAVVADEIRELVNLTLPPIDQHDTLASSLAMFRYVEEHRALWSALLTGGAAGTIREELAKEARRRVPADIPPDVTLPVELGVVVGVAGTIETIAWWLRQEPPVSVERAAEYHDRLILRPAMLEQARTA